MARTLTLARISSKSFSSAKANTSPSSFPTLQSIRSSAHRYFSARVPKAQLIEIDLDSDGEVAAEHQLLGLKRLEDVYHDIIVRRSAPDWLPFRPGLSYWVPPRPRAESFVDIVDKLTTPLVEEEASSVTSVRGWPSSSFFLEGITSPNPVPMEVAVQVNVPHDTDKMLECDDEE